jgi:hypothetical protein
MPPKSNLLYFPRQPATPALDLEDATGYEALLRDLIDEHQPANAVESALVEQMAQQRQLMGRWMILQQRAFTFEAVPKELPMMMRQHAAAERSFHQALASLVNFRKRHPK